MKYLQYSILGLLIAILAVACNSEDTDSPDPDYLDLIKDRLEYMNMPRPEGSYNYPIYPGMKAWADFTTTPDMVAACQVPTVILKEQSTQAVIQAIWEYPFFYEVMLEYGRYQRAYENILSSNNAYKELIRRSDAGICLFQRYILVEPCKEGVTILPRTLEFMISQECFLSQLTPDDKIALMKTIFEKEHQREIRGVPLLSATTIATHMLMGRIMVSSGYIPFTEEVDKNEVLSYFLETSLPKVYTDDEYAALMNFITRNAKNFTTE